MNDQSRKALEAYYAEAATWNHDRVQSLRGSSRTAWRIAGAAGTIAALEALALALMMPLKTVEPYTLMVDRTTGYVQALRPLDQAQIAPDAALTQSFLAQYVVARESFDLATLNTNYRRTALLSADRAREAYLRSMQAASPDNPLNRYPRTSAVDARVKSVSPLGNGSALVRFDTLRSDAGGTEQSPSSWVAIIRYRYSRAPMSLEDRLVNPLGFQVTGYRKDPESAPTVVATGPSPAIAPVSAGGVGVTVGQAPPR